jgi:UDP-N-acetylmuramate--alanine ligase
VREEERLGDTRYHFVGIGGLGMSAIARILLGKGCQVSGSDVRPSDITRQLETLGARVAIGHSQDNLNGATTVVFSSAVGDTNPEVQAARRCGLEVMSRGEMLGRLMQSAQSIAVSGTHGKTTTAAMVATVLDRCGLDPTVLLGGPGLGGNARLGKGKYLVAEACEAFGSFFYLKPDIAVITNIDADHLDFYGNLEGVREGFARFLRQVKETGCAVLCLDSEDVAAIRHKARCRVVTYGINTDADITAAGIEPAGNGTSYRVVSAGRPGVRVSLSVPGAQNVANSLAAIAVGRELNIPEERIADALATFRGVGRRFELLGEACGVKVIDDYAHHPAEIAATLRAARKWRSPGRLMAVFQPHLYSRTGQLLDSFATCFADADEVYITDIYGAREQPINGVTGQLLAEKVAANRPGVLTEFVSPKERIIEILLSRVREDDMVVFLGAGDIREVGEDMARRLACRAREAPQ